MDHVRFGIVGMGNMGTYHANYFGAVENAKLTAICEVDARKLETARSKFPSSAAFASYDEMLSSGLIDAVLVATPHYQHTDMAIAAFEKGLHVQCEKPAAVTVKEARRMNDASARFPKLKFGMNFQMRTNPTLKKVRELIQKGELGEITRLTWIVTNWFRTNSYYASGGWRATWAGEGGGVLINQSPHNLDQLAWLTGMMPSRVTAIAHVGKTHPIEVEDEVSAILEYENGCTAHFITTTGEAPGTDRLEIAGDKGKLVAEGGKLTFRMNRIGTREFRETSPLSFAIPECWDTEIPLTKSEAEPARLMTQNFVNAVLKDEPLIAPGVEGVRGLEIGNAMLLSGVRRKPVDLPVDGDEIDALIKELAGKYAGKKSLQIQQAGGSDMGSSFGRRN